MIPYIRAVLYVSSLTFAFSTNTMEKPEDSRQELKERRYDFTPMSMDRESLREERCPHLTASWASLLSCCSLFWQDCCNQCESCCNVFCPESGTSIWAGCCTEDNEHNMGSSSSSDDSDND